MSHHLLIVAHTPSHNTVAMKEALVRGASHSDIDNVELRVLDPLGTTVEDVAWAEAVIIMTTENFGYMAGLIKDFFERIYYPCLETKQGLPYALVVRAGLDGTGTQIAVGKIIQGLKWKPAQENLLCHGDWEPAFLQQCEALGMTVAAGLEAGVF